MYWDQILIAGEFIRTFLLSAFSLCRHISTFLIYNIVLWFGFSHELSRINIYPSSNKVIWIAVLKIAYHWTFHVWNSLFCHCWLFRDDTLGTWVQLMSLEATSPLLPHWCYGSSYCRNKKTTEKVVISESGNINQALTGSCAVPCAF